MSAPDVRVRLSPEGVAEVVAALKKIQAESAAANKASGRGVGVVTAALRELKALLPTIGLAAFVAGFAAMTRHALEVAEATGKLQEKVGGTTEEISALTLAFRQNQSNQEELANLLRRTTVLMDELRAGSQEVPEGLSRIGVELRDIQGLDAPRVFELIAQRLSNIPDPATRAAIATDIFKKNASDLIPALNAVGSQGIDKFIERARELGVVIDTDLADAAARANDALGDIKLVAEGVATQFASGFAPVIAAAMEDFSESLEVDGVNAMEKFGRGVGIIIRSIIFAFTSMGKIVGASLAAIGVQIEGFVEASKAALTLDVRGTFEATQRAIRRTNEIRRTLIEDLKRDFENIATPPAPRERPGPGRRSSGGGAGVTPEDKRIADARIAFLKSQLDNELAIAKANIQARQDLDEQAYRQGLITLQEYFRRRRELARQAADAELKALRAQRAVLVSTEAAELQKLTQQRDETRRQALGGGRGGASRAGAGGSNDQTEAAARASNLDADLQARRLKLREQLADIDAKIQVRRIEFEREMQGLTAEEAQQQRDLTDQQIAGLAQLNELEGKRHEAFVLNLAQETQAVVELLKRAGASEDEIQQRVNRLATARTTNFAFEEVARRGRAALEAFDRDAEQIRRDQEAGVIGQIEGEDRLIELQRQRLVVLKQLAAESLKAAEATGNPEIIEQAQRYAASVREIETSFIGASDVIVRVRKGLAEGFREGTRNIIENIDQIHTLRDAWEMLGDTILNVLKQISADIISKSLTRGIENAIAGLGNANAGGGGGGGGAGFWAGVASFIGGLFGARHGGLLRRYAGGGQADASGGGQVHGSGTGSSDSIPALIDGRRLVRIANEEFIVRQPVVKQPGALSFLRNFNQHGMAALRVPRFAAGGLMAAAISSAPMSAASRLGGDRRPLNVTQNIQAPDRETGRRTAKQAGAELARALRQADSSNN